MARGMREFFKAIPILGAFLRSANASLKLPAILERANAANEERDNRIAELTDSLDRYRRKIEGLSSGQSESDLLANNHLLDVFYTHFEDMFRGSEEMIANRLETHVPIFLGSEIDFKKYPVLDIGSGRGEFLAVMAEHKISAIGLDINYDMVERAKRKKLKAIQGNAIEFLQNDNVQKYGAITGFHIIEHIPFPQLMELFSNAYSALVPEGFVLFETPNPENIVVGACNFYTDPSHLHPLPPPLIQFALETCGFKNVTIIPLHPVEDLPEDSENLPESLKNYFYGPRDYAVIGYK